MANEIQELKFQVGDAWKGAYNSSTVYGLANVVQDTTGLSVYRSLKSGNVGHPVTDTLWWFCIIDMSSIKAASDNIVSLNQSIAQNETQRGEAEVLRQQNEAQRQSAEVQRNETEQVRITNENQRQSAEITRNNSEQQRINSEQQRVNHESERVQSEQDRVLAEKLRSNSEDERASNEQNRIAAEQNRVSAEQYRETTFATFEGQIDAKLNKITEEQFNQIFE